MQKCPINKLSHVGSVESNSSPVDEHRFFWLVQFNSQYAVYFSAQLHNTCSFPSIKHVCRLIFHISVVSCLVKYKQMFQCMLRYPCSVYFRFEFTVVMSKPLVSPECWGGVDCEVVYTDCGLVTEWDMIRATSSMALLNIICTINYDETIYRISQTT